METFHLARQLKSTSAMQAQKHAPSHFVGGVLPTAIKHQEGWFMCKSCKFKESFIKHFAGGVLPAAIKLLK